MKKLFILIMKYLPIMQLLSTLITNTLYYFNIAFDNAMYIDFIFGNSLFNIIALYITSYTLKFCKWHRLLITCNLVNLIIMFIDCRIYIPITDFQLLISYYIIVCIFIILIIYFKLKDNDNKKII